MFTRSALVGALIGAAITRKSSRRKRVRWRRDSVARLRPELMPERSSMAR